MTVLEDLLQARRTMDYLATSAPTNVFEIAKMDYLKKLKDYHGKANYEDQEQFERFVNSEAERTKQLSLFNSSGPDYADTGVDKKVRERITSDGRKSADV